MEHTSEVEQFVEAAHSLLERLRSRHAFVPGEVLLLHHTVVQLIVELRKWDSEVSTESDDDMQGNA